MAVNKNEVSRYIEEVRAVRNRAVGASSNPVKDNKRVSPSLNPQYIGVYLFNYYSKDIHNDLLKF